MTHPELPPGRRPGAFLALAVGLTLIAAVLAAPTTASAHPLGNFSVNHVTTVRISEDEVRLRYLLDQAEIPTVQERGPPLTSNCSGSAPRCCAASS
jgi:nickel/cobalt exporter